MIVINAEYVRQFGVELQTYHDAFDVDVWDDLSAKQFSDNDLRALTEGRPIEVTERITQNGLHYEVDVIKWPKKIKVKDQIKTLVAGVVKHVRVRGGDG